MIEPELAALPRADAARARAIPAGSAPPVSSMWIGASLSWPHRVRELLPVVVGQASGAHACAGRAGRPSRSCASQVASRPFPCRTSRPAAVFDGATCSPMLSANAVLPIDGRPATMTRSPSCRPEVMRSRSAKPVGDAGDVGRIVAVVQQLDALDDLRQQRPDFLETLRAARALLGDLEHLRFGFVENLAHFRPSGLKARSAISRPTAASRRRIARSRTISA